MAFAIRDLSVLAYANGFTLWHYKAGTDSPPSVAQEGFFADAVDMMAKGDLIIVTGPEGGRLLCVAATEAGTVVTAPLAR